MRARIIRTTCHKVTEFTKEQKKRNEEINNLRDLHKRFHIPIGVKILFDENNEPIDPNKDNNVESDIILMSDKYGEIKPTSIFFAASQNYINQLTMEV